MSGDQLNMGGWGCHQWPMPRGHNAVTCSDMWHRLLGHPLVYPRGRPPVCQQDSHLSSVSVRPCDRTAFSQERGGALATEEAFPAPAPAGGSVFCETVKIYLCALPALGHHHGKPQHFLQCSVISKGIILWLCSPLTIEKKPPIWVQTHHRAANIAQFSDSIPPLWSLLLQIHVPGQ